MALIYLSILKRIQAFTAKMLEIAIEERIGPDGIRIYSSSTGSTWINADDLMKSPRFKQAVEQIRELLEGR